MLYVIAIQIDLPSERDGFSYGWLTATGNSLPELLKFAQISVHYNGELRFVEPADAVWMQELVEQEFVQKYGGSGTNNGNVVALSINLT